MQKLFNVMSVAAFTMSAGMVAGSVLLYTRIPALTKYYMSELTLEMTKIVTNICLLYTSPSPRDGLLSRMPSSA